jgi:hypothetical protein
VALAALNWMINSRRLVMEWCPDWLKAIVWPT